MSQQNYSQSGKIFSDRLKSLRKDRKKAEFQRFLGINSPVTYHNYESGRIPDAGMLEQIASCCGVTVDWLLGRDDSPAPNFTHDRGVMSETKGSPNSENPENIADSLLVTGVSRAKQKGRGVADYPRMEPMAKDEAALSNARQLIATMMGQEDGDRLLGYLATILMWLNTAIHPDMDPAVKATALLQAHLVVDKLAGKPGKKTECAASSTR